MANPIASDAEKPMTFVATTTQATCTLEGDRDYIVSHTGFDTSTAASTDLVVLSTATTPSITFTGDANKFMLASGKSVIIGPQISTLVYRSTANSPVFSISPGPRFMGQC